MSVLSALLTAAPAAADGLSLPGKLVSPEWLEANLSAADLRIFDVRADVRDYWAGHIPGAVFFHPEAIRLANRGVPVKLMPPEALTVILGKMGVTRETAVVVYGESNDFFGPYLIWALDYLGHRSSALLDGGFAQWQKKRRVITQDYPDIQPARYRTLLRCRNELRATLAEVRWAVERGGSVVVDVRPVELYAGGEGSWKRKGHMPGAISHFWGDDLAADGSWKAKSELTTQYRRLGVVPEKPIIVSCGQGQMSAHTYFVLKYILGYPDVRNYDGGFNEWSNIADLPVEKGMK